MVGRGPSQAETYEARDESFRALTAARASSVMRSRLMAWATRRPAAAAPMAVSAAALDAVVARDAGVCSERRQDVRVKSTSLVSTVPAVRPGAVW